MCFNAHWLECVEMLATILFSSADFYRTTQGHSCLLRQDASALPRGLRCGVFAVNLKGTVWKRRRL
jgi:hypothetical protein